MQESPRHADRKSARTSNGRTCRDLRVAVGAEIRRLRDDAGLSQRRLAALAELDHGYLSLVERGIREPSLSVLVAIATALGGRLNIRLYPGTGPRISDPIQARIVEELVGTLHQRWVRMVEVAVYRPSRGFIDLVAHDRAGGVVLAIEVQSQLRRLEQQVRWLNEKADSLPSAEFWRFASDTPRIERVLVLRSTRLNRELAARFAQTLATTYPSRSRDACAAMRTANAPWPGSALLWARFEGNAVKILDDPPRGVPFGR